MTTLGEGSLIALTLQPDAVGDDCERTAVMVTARQPPADCRAMVIDRQRLQNQGATTLRRSSDGFVAEATRARGLHRPWAQGPINDGEMATSTHSGSRSRPVEATPAETDLQPDDQ